MPQALHQPQAGNPPVKALLQARLGIATPADSSPSGPPSAKTRKKFATVIKACPAAGDSGIEPPSATCKPAAMIVKAAGKTIASAVQPHPIRHRRQRPRQIRRPARPPTFAATSTAAMLGPKLPANISIVASAFDCGLMAGDSSQQVHDQAKVRKKNALKRVEGLDSFIAQASL